MVMKEENIRYALRNLKARKSRSILTILSIFLGIAAIFIFASFGWGLYDYVNEFTTGSSVDKIVVQPKGSGQPGLDETFQLTNSDLRTIDRVAGVKEVTGAAFDVAQTESNNEKRYTFIMSFDPKNTMMFELADLEIIKGRNLQPGEKGKALVGYNYQKENNIFTKPLELNDNIEINGEKAKIIGIMSEVGNPQDDSQLYITQEYFEELYPEKKDSYGWVIARVEVDNIDRIIENVEKAVRKNRGLEEGKEDFFVQSFQEMIESFTGAIDIIIGFVILIALISVLVSAVNTANTMVTSVLERTKEIGIIKSIGAKNSEILKLFLFESATLGFLAGILGVLVGYSATSIGAIILENLGWGFLQPHYSTILFLGCITFATITGAISGLIPAYNASKTNVVDALRYE